MYEQDVRKWAVFIVSIAAKSMTQALMYAIIAAPGSINPYRIRKMLLDTSDGLPPITLSIGVAFSDRQNPTNDILKDADTALYITKERGKNGYTFYGED